MNTVKIKQRLLLGSFALCAYFMPYAYAMDQSRDVVSALRKFELRDDATDLCTICHRDSDSMLLSAARQHLPRVMKAMLNCGTTVQERDSSIFLNTIFMGDFELLYLLADKHALIDFAGFDALLSMADSLEDPAAKAEVKRLTESFAQKLLQNMSAAQYAVIAHEALSHGNTRVIDFLRTCGFLPKRTSDAGVIMGNPQEVALALQNVKSRAIAAALMRRGTQK